MAMAMAEGEGGWGWMAELAGEELAKLEAAHPGRFGPLKAELKRLIADPAWDNAAAPPLASPDDTTTSSSSQSASVLHLVSTQESSSRKMSRGCNGSGTGTVGGGGEQEGKRRRSATAAGKDRAEMAIERAERCLERIRAFKASLLGFSN